ncbi:hypothetical protein [Leptolyngbya sp. FACHB-261]|uniref:hypothetical protein n=1 Tax=Leptolyngbya sp. FACHB-261 TaxID=2692806 RepID=UPI001F554489|nr:hypothetical protein [Leptolyngbya sp. FACHB-261]
MTLTGNSQTGDSYIATWLDDKQQLNYVRIQAHSAPDELIPERPFLLRVSVNRGIGIAPRATWGKECQGLNRDWHLELTVLPEEILDFLPWIVSFVKTHSSDNATTWAQEPPHPFDFQRVADTLLLSEAWTRKASQLKSACLASLS